MELRAEQLDTLAALFSELNSIAHQASRVLQTDAAQRTLFTAYMVALRDLENEASLLTARCISKAGIVDVKASERLETLGRAASYDGRVHCPNCYEFRGAAPPPTMHRPETCPYRPMGT